MKSARCLRTEGKRIPVILFEQKLFPGSDSAMPFDWFILTAIVTCPPLLMLMRRVIMTGAKGLLL